MGVTTVERTDDYTIELDTDLGVPIFTWNRYVSGERFKEVSRTWEGVIEDEGAERYVVNTEGVTAHDAEDKQWLAETWIPSLIERGVRAGAGVFADSAIASMDMNGIEKKLSAIDPDFEFRVFATDEEAKDWLADQ